MKKRLLEIAWNKRGSQLVEASISMPVVIIVIILLIRLLVFYLEILTTSIDEHNAAWKAWGNYSGRTVAIYEHSTCVEMVKGGLLNMNIKKDFNTEVYIFNEDYMVRLGEIIDKK